MRQVRGYLVVVGAFALASFFTQSAHAQDVNAGAGASGSAQTSGTAGAAAGGAATATPAATAPTPPATTTTTTVATPTAVATSTTTTPAKDDDNGATDHEQVVGNHLGFTYFGVSQLPIAAAPGGGGGGGGGLAATRDNVNAPVIGIRYWIMEKLGLDVGVGFGVNNGSVTVTRNGVDTSTDKPSRTGFAFHVGVPIDLHSAKHYSLEIIPEVTTGLASGSIGGLGAGVPDISLSGFRLDAGARIGAEIYFGFIGIPQLALEGTVGLYYRHEQFKVSQGNNGASDSTNTITTSVNADPWAIFVNNISAIYYF